MNWLISTFSSSIGKKLLMALTGLCFCAFLVVHLIGNLTLYGGKGFFVAYVEHLHAFGPLVTVAEFGLLALAAIHVIMGTLLFIGNQKARPKHYQVNSNAGGRTLGSGTMPYTGFLILLFLIFHLINFRFVEQSPETLYRLVTEAFSHPFYILIYLFGVALAAIHVSHGFWSAFQTLGGNHPKYMPIIQDLGLIFCLVVAVGFGFIPLFILTVT